jgi:hypothetical protein
MQPLRQSFIRVRLDAQRLADTQHLEQEGQVTLGGVGVFGDDGFGQVFLWIRGEDLGERAGGRGLVRWEGYVSAHPELRTGNGRCKQISSIPFDRVAHQYLKLKRAMNTHLGIGLLVVRSETLDASFSKLGCQAGRADLTPVVRLDARGDLENGLEGRHL